MARVEIAPQGWGLLADRAGNVRVGLPFTLQTLDGVDQPIYTTKDGSTEAVKQTAADGSVPGWVDQGTYVLSYSSGGTTVSREVVAMVGPPVILGTGDQVGIGTTIQTRGQMLHSVRGTAASPDRVPHPLIKAERTVDHRLADVSSGAAPEEMSAIYGIATALVTAEKQPIGVMGVATTSSQQDDVTKTADALGVQGYARMLAGANGAGEGGYFAARMDSTDTLCRIYGIEIQIQNNSGANINYANGYGRATGLLLTASGNATFKDAGSAIKILRNSVTTPSWDVGLAFPLGSGGNLGGVKTASIRDDCAATTSYVINGSHTYGIDASGGTFTGPVLRLGANYIDLAEKASDPSAPSADHGLLYLKDDGAGATRPYMRTSAGVMRVLLEGDSLASVSHHNTHERGGSDEITVENLVGDRFDWLRSSEVSSMPRMLATQTAALTSGLVYAVKVRARTAGTYSKIRFATGGAGASVTDLRAGVWTSAGVLLAQTADLSGSFATNTLFDNVALDSSVTLTEGQILYIGVGTVAGTAVQLRGAPITVTGICGLSPALTANHSGLTAGAAMGNLTNLAGPTSVLPWVELIP